jgi:hypothetical protein
MASLCQYNTQSASLKTSKLFHLDLLLITQPDPDYWT